MNLILALILSMQYDWADGAVSRAREFPLPKLVKNSPSLPPYKDVIGPAASPPASDAPPPPPPPNCMMLPPPARPTLPAPLPPASSPSASPSSTPPSIAPGGGSPPPAFRPPVAFPSSPPPRDARPGLWCVANPTAAMAMLQPAMDYACGSGADCEMTAPGGPCHLPDTLMAHASYAFNSYWQRTKVAGATCDFAGAAVLVTKDPSYDGCHYVYL
ncbi:hypothetical protein QOZ80_6AG0547500 [Eleusine coracana subsp. coracana]|nr:hypothetical protein QOZ80_6AG0547500 [Eleusine coracana subsp. coracana]